MDESDRLDPAVILTDLTKQRPLYDDGYGGESCVFCSALDPSRGFEYHDPSCVWRRAIEAGNIAWRDHPV